MSWGSFETQSQLISASLVQAGFACRMACNNSAWSVGSANFKFGENS
jgi:hypothetical protein